MTRGRLAIHAHFYQPERRDPFGGPPRPEPAAAPFASWNARITAECYRPNAERGNVDHISFNVGPTLTSYLASDAPEVLGRIAVAGRAQNALAQGFHHAILPLASRRDRRTEVRWGMRDYQVRFGHAPSGFWLPETAVDEAILRMLAEEGIRWTSSPGGCTAPMSAAVGRS
jgi:alpha-amylase/alpha-mannosidase (GH57 family)